MSTNFCIGCGAPLETTQNFTAKKCSYCGLENSYIIPKREKNKPFFQRFFAFKKTTVPIREKNFSQNEEKYRERTKNIVNNQISQIQMREIIKNKSLLRKNKSKIILGKFFNSIKWKVRRKLIFLIFALTVSAGILNYFIVRYDLKFDLNRTIDWSNYINTITNTKTAYEYQLNIENFLDNEQFLEAYNLSSAALKRYPGFTRFRLYRGIASWKYDSRLSSLKDLNIGLEDFCWRNSQNPYCGWGYGCRAYLNYDRAFFPSAIKDSFSGVFSAKDNIWRYYDLVDILFKTKTFESYSRYVKNKKSIPLPPRYLTGSRYSERNLAKYWIKNFLTVSEIAVAKFEYNDLTDNEKEYLIKLYLMQAKYYYQYEKDLKPKKRYKKALAVLDKIFKLDKNNKEAIFLKDSVSKSL